MEIDKKEVLRYLKTKGRTDESLDKAIDSAIEEVKALISPKYGYKIFDIIDSENGIALKNTTVVLTGNSIKRRLKNCGKCILLYATLGFMLDKEIIRLQNTGLSKALVTDACGSAALESICDNVCKEIEEKFIFKLTKRFSPGYGDLPVNLNKHLLSALDAFKQAGIILNEGGMMSPSKTVTAILGVVKENGI